MKNQISFIVVILVICLFSACKSNKSQENTSSITEPIHMENPNESKLLRHVVIFKFKESASAEDIKAVEMAFAALPGKIPEIKDYEWGINNSPESLNKGFTHCFFLTFESEADRAVYLPHPDHKAFGDVLGPVLEDVLVFDYWTSLE